VLVIRAEQMRVFEQAAWQRFEGEMIAHSKNFSPRLSAVLGDNQLRIAVLSAIGKARGYGFTNRGPIRLYIELMFLYGSGFDTDPQYPAIGVDLRARGEQMERAERIHTTHTEYLDRVQGPSPENVLAGIKALSTAVRAIAPDGGFVAEMLGELRKVCPQKAAYSGEAGLNGLIEEGIAEARQFPAATVRLPALLIELKFAFGHGCSDDPLYPWIARTLKDKKIVGPEVRAARLEKKAITWINHVILAKSQGLQM
jgi:hypothetical protein